MTNDNHQRMMINDKKKCCYNILYILHRMVEITQIQNVYNYIIYEYITRIFKVIYMFYKILFIFLCE